MLMLIGSDESDEFIWFCGEVVMRVDDRRGVAARLLSPSVASVLFRRVSRRGEDLCSIAHRYLHPIVIRCVVRAFLSSLKICRSVKPLLFSSVRLFCYNVHRSLTSSTGQRNMPAKPYTRPTSGNCQT